MPHIKRFKKFDYANMQWRVSISINNVYSVRYIIFESPLFQKDDKPRSLRKVHDGYMGKTCIEEMYSVLKNEQTED